MIAELRDEFFHLLKCARHTPRNACSDEESCFSYRPTFSAMTSSLSSSTTQKSSNGKTGDSKRYSHSLRSAASFVNEAYITLILASRSLIRLVMFSHASITY